MAGIASAYKPSRDRMEKKKTEGLTRVNGVNTKEPCEVDFLCTKIKVCTMHSLSCVITA